MTATAQPAMQSHPINPDRAWQQLLARDARAQFFYGVTTTGVFCRMGCSSRKPRRENVRFFSTPAEATRAGFCPCIRCKPSDDRRNALDEVRAFIENNADRNVNLEELAQIAGISPFTVQRKFKQSYGVSPLQYQRSLRAQRLRAALKQGESVTEAIYTAGFSSPSRAYEGAPLGMTPSRFSAGGRGERISWATVPSSLGMIAVGSTPRGICWLSFVDSVKQAEQMLRTEFPAATLVRDETLIPQVNAVASEIANGSKAKTASPQVDLKGTAFQLRVWEALRRIPRGETRSYSQLAAELGNPKAARAVARACATNRVAVLVPCHRVIGVNGSATGYRWGVERKKQLLEGEKSRH